MGTEPSTLRDWLSEHPPDDSAFTQAIAGVARRHQAGEDFMPAVRELLDEFAPLMTDGQRARALGDEPRATGDRRLEAYLGAEESWRWRPTCSAIVSIPRRASSSRSSSRR